MGADAENAPEIRAPVPGRPADSRETRPENTRTGARTSGGDTASIAISTAGCALHGPNKNRCPKGKFDMRPEYHGVQRGDIGGHIAHATKQNSRAKYKRDQNVLYRAKNTRIRAGRKDRPRLPITYTQAIRIRTHRPAAIRKNRRAERPI